jgi:hypothetical protein
MGDERLRGRAISGTGGFGDEKAALPVGDRESGSRASSRTSA